MSVVSMLDTLTSKNRQEMVVIIKNLPCRSFISLNFMHSCINLGKKYFQSFINTGYPTFLFNSIIVYTSLLLLKNKYEIYSYIKLYGTLVNGWLMNILYIMRR